MNDGSRGGRWFGSAAVARPSGARINRDGTNPATNPFSTRTTGRNRAIWALGLRNPFKFAVRPSSGTIFMNDVGETAWEEIDRGAPGANYGWDLYEGPESDPAYVDPLFAYPHDADPATSGCAITGGVFYEPINASFPTTYHGDYFFAEFCNGWIRSYDEGSGVASGFTSGLTRVVDLDVSAARDLY
jgi:glucose/arabinose dehydrogenase